MTSPQLTPPFRADIVGSFLRPDPLKMARAGRLDGTVSAQELTAVEDEEIRRLVQQQANAGLQLATDGEFRRSWWHFDFLDMLDGVELRELDHGIQFQGVQTKPRGLAITGEIGFPASHPMVAHYEFVANETRVTAAMPKATIPSPLVLDFRLERDAISTGHYADRDAIFDDLVTSYRAAIRAYYDAGCRYLQFDDTVWAYLCSEEELAKAEARGMHTDGIADRYVELINACLADRPDDMTITTHVCRGNFRSTWISSGGYEPVAEQLLAGCDYDGYFLEYDSERAGGFEPLRHLPSGKKIVVLGLITTKSGELESRDDVISRIREAEQFAPLEQLALSPQCGFASTEEGNVLTEAEQWGKIREVVDIANEVWSS